MSSFEQCFDRTERLHSNHIGVVLSFPNVQARLALTLSIICLTAGCSRSGSTRTATLSGVKGRTPATGDALDVECFPGKIEASKQVELAFQVPGVLVRLRVKEGQIVAKGEIIAQLRLDEFHARLETVKGQLDQARATLNAMRLGGRPEDKVLLETQERVTAVILANAQKQFDRYAQLIPFNAVSRSEYETVETAYHVAEENHKTAVQLLEKGTTARKEDIEAQEGMVRGLAGLFAEAKLQLEDGTLRAPYDSVVAQRFVDEGQSITVSKPVVQLRGMDGIAVIAYLPEAVISNIRSPSVVGMFAEISEAAGGRYPVQIQEIAQVADARTRTFPVRFAMKAPPDVTIMPGMSASVILICRRARNRGDRIPVPTSAVCTEPSVGPSAGEHDG